MAILRKIDTVMTGVAGTPYYNSLYFTTVESVSAVDMVQAVADLWGDLLALSTSQLIAEVQGEIARFDDATQEIVGFEQAQSTTRQGGLTAPQYPRATQALVRLRTDTVVAGRRVQGRIFVPGIAGSSVDPTVSTDVQSQYNGIMAAFLTQMSSLGPLRVNSRTNSTSAVVTSASTWDQWSVLRSRRD